MRDPTFQTLFPIFINHYQSMFRVHDLSGEELIASLFDMSRLKNSFDNQPLTDLEAILFQDIEPYPDWEQGRRIIVEVFTVPEWLRKINK